MKAAYRFPEPVKEVNVPRAVLFKVCDFQIPDGMVAFMKRFATPMIEGGYGVLTVDGEVVTDGEVVGNLVEGKIVEEVDSLLNPPVVAEKSIVYEFYSPVEAILTVIVDGELWTQVGERRPAPREYRPEVVPVPVYVVPRALEAVVEERREEAEAIPVKVHEGERVRTTPTPLDMENLTISAYMVVWEKKGVGEITEMWLKAEATNFDLAIYADGEHPYYGDYGWYASRSADSEDISAEQRDGEYVIHVQHVKFKESAAVIVVPYEPIHFNHIYVKYEMES